MWTNNNYVLKSGNSCGIVQLYILGSRIIEMEKFSAYEER